MPPGASLIMRGIGMRQIDREMKDHNRGRAEPGKYDRPKVFYQDDHYYYVPRGTRGTRGHGNFETPPYMNDEAFNKHRGNSAGLSGDPVTREFQYDRSLWSRRGYTSPFKYNRSRSERNRLEFELWLYHHPRRESVVRRISKMDPDDPRLRRPSGHHQRGWVDIRDPRYCPPYSAHYHDREDRGGRIGPPHWASIGGRDTHPPHHPGFDVPRHKKRRESFGEPFGGYYPPNRGRGPSHIPPYYDPRADGGDMFAPPIDSRHPRHYPPRHPGPYEDPYNFDFDFDSDISSQSSSTDSFDRPPHHRRRHPSPHIVYPNPPPYYGGPLRDSHRHGRRHKSYLDDEDDEDEMYRGRGTFGHGRHGGRFRSGRRGFERGDGEYGFSGDEDDRYGY